MTNAKSQFAEKTNTLSWELHDGVLELALDEPPCNEIGSAMLEDLEQFVAAMEAVQSKAAALIVYSKQEAGFSAGAHLRELYRASSKLGPAERVRGVRAFLERMHGVLNAIDASPLTTIAVVHGVTFGGGFELALASDLIVADKMARFCFPELRLGLIPGFGGIPRLRRDIGNALVRDLLLTGRIFGAEEAARMGLISEIVAPENLMARARELAQKYGERFEPPASLVEMAERGEIYSDDPALVTTGS